MNEISRDVFLALMKNLRAELGVKDSKKEYLDMIAKRW